MADLPELDPNSILLADPHGEIQQISNEEALPALQQGGYHVPDPALVAKHVEAAQYSTPTQKTIAGLEATARGLAGPFATGAELASGLTSREAIAAREEHNPSLAQGLEGAALIGSSLYGVGEGALLLKAGEGAVKAARLAEASSVTAKIGSAAVRNAAEFALYQSGNEIHKMMTDQGDPNAPVQTALTNIGLSGLLGAGAGAGFGAIHPLWKATVGNKFEKVLGALSERVNGGSVLSDATEAALQKTGIEAEPTIRAALSEDPVLQTKFLDLAQSDTGSGRQVQESLQNFRQQAAKSTLEAAGRTEADLPAIQNLSKADSGVEIGNSLRKDFEERLAGPVEDFEKIKTEFSKAEFTDAQKGYFMDKLGQYALDQNFQKLFDQAPQKFMQHIFQRIGEVTNLEDFRNIQSQVLKEAGGNEAFRSAGMYRGLKGLFREAEDRFLTETVGKEAPYLSGQLQAARNGYREFMELADRVDDRLHVGSYYSAKGFIKNMESMLAEHPEKFADRLLGKNDAKWLELVKQGFPEVAEKVKDYHLSQLLKQAATAAKNGEVLHPTKLLNGVNKLSPELKGFLFSPESLEKLNGVQGLLKKVDELPWNTSRTAPTLDRMRQWLPSSVVGTIAMLEHHNPVTAGLMGMLTKYLGRDVPDAAKLSLIKFLASSRPIESGGFKAMVDFVHHTTQGENLILKGVSALFKATGEVISSKLVPQEKDRKRLDKKLADLQKDNTPLLNIGGQTAHYLPNQGTALAQTSANAVNYLNALRPASEKQNPLDAERKPNPVEQSHYDRALDIAEQPLVVLKHLKEGTLTSQDLGHLKVLYPALQERLVQKVTEQMMTHLSKDEPIPFSMRKSLSLFLGHPLDSTLTPQSLQQTQKTFQPEMPSPPPVSGGKKAPQTALNHLAKSMSLGATPLQTRERSKLRS